MSKSSKKFFIYFLIYVNFMLIYVQKLFTDGRATQNYSSEPYKKDCLCYVTNIKKYFKRI